MAVVGGMVASTALTLIVVPVFHALLARFAGDPARSTVEKLSGGAPRLRQFGRDGSSRPET
jgi:hypothetical protein